MPIVIISATPGLTTTEEILNLILSHPEGLSIKQLSLTLNRPVSMIQICLKSLIADKKIYVRTNKNKIQPIYYPYNSQINLEVN